MVKPTESTRLAKQRSRPYTLRLTEQQRSILWRALQADKRMNAQCWEDGPNRTPSPAAVLAARIDNMARNRKSRELADGDPIVKDQETG